MHGVQGSAQPGTDPDTDYLIWCAQVELSTGLVSSPAPAQAEVPRCRLLVRLHGETLGYLLVRRRPTNNDADVLAEAWRAFETQITRHLQLDGLSVAAGAAIPPADDHCSARVPEAVVVSVIVCSRDRATQLARCIAGLRQLTYPRLEILVVDNAPKDDAPRRVIDAAAQEDARIRYVLAEQPGLSRARNAGLAAARGELVAYTDDDVTVDPSWIHGIVGGFLRSGDIGCVTGLVGTAQIDNQYEAYFDARTASWSRRVAPTVYPPAAAPSELPLYPYAAGQFGTGANFAFRREVLNRVGGFDPVLGAGTETRGGEDLDIFVRIARAGWAIAYEPSAIVWHRHRADRDALQSQLSGYGVGFTAYLTKLLLQRDTRWDVVRRVPRAVAHAVRIHRLVDDDPMPPKPKGMLRAELLGYLQGPGRYMMSRRQSNGADTEKSGS